MLLALLLQVAVPAEVGALPPLALLRRPSVLPTATSRFVRDEVRSGRCEATPLAAAGRESLTVDIAVLVAANGSIQGVRPRAIGCSAVEQYAVGVATRLIRDNVRPPAAPAWFRFPVTFTWAT